MYQGQELEVSAPAPSPLVVKKAMKSVSDVRMAMKSRKHSILFTGMSFCLQKNRRFRNKMKKKKQKSNEVEATRG